MFCSIDATKESDDLARLANHALEDEANAKMMIVGHDAHEKPRAALFAKEPIETGTEIKWDYGDRSAESLASFPFLG